MEHLYTSNTMNMDNDVLIWQYIWEHINKRIEVQRVSLEQRK
jgi:hypothetical protein